MLQSEAVDESEDGVDDDVLIVVSEVNESSDGLVSSISSLGSPLPMVRVSTPRSDLHGAGFRLNSDEAA